MKSNVIQFPLNIEFDDEVLSDLYKVQAFLRETIMGFGGSDTFTIKAINKAINILTEEVTAYMTMVGK